MKTKKSLDSIRSKQTFKNVRNQRGATQNTKLIIIGIIIAVLVGGGVWYYQDQQAKKQKEETTKSQEEAKKREEDLKKELEKLKKESGEEEDEENKNGTIEGSLSYPSEVIPEDMKICAVNTSTNKETCTSNHIKNSKYTNGIGYKIEVPAGNYNVYASTSQMSNYKAYYSAAVKCGLEETCSNHDPIKVTVTAGETVSKIDPADWYGE